MENYIVPIRRFGKATHVVVGMIADLNEPEVVYYLPLESECSLPNFDTEFMKEIIYCSEFDWYRLKLKMNFEAHKMLRLAERNN